MGAATMDMFLLLMLAFVWGMMCQQNQDAPCSSEVAILNKKLGGRFSPTCNGEYYRSKQCDRGECWCVYPKNGEEIPNTRGEVKDMKAKNEFFCLGDTSFDPYNFRLMDGNATFIARLETEVKQLTDTGGAAMFYGDRPGEPTEWHECHKRATKVPRHLTFITRYNYYQKYKTAFNIPIVSSGAVGEAALTRACYVLFFLMADRKVIRRYLYKKYGRLGIIGRYEGTTSIPEHRHLGSWWDQRARGLGGTLQVPISTGTEENLLCERTDRYPREDIFLHEFSHGISEVSIQGGAIRGYYQRLKSLYYQARSRGLWARTYAMSTYQEYFAEGVQSYFEVNDYAPSPNGVHGPVNTRAKLKRYDPQLYAMVREVFPCGNRILKRCDAKKGVKMPPFYMNCDGNGRKLLVTDFRKRPTGSGGGGTGGGGTDEGETGGGGNDCQDENPKCAAWARRGECKKNPEYMLVSCKKSCKAKGCKGTKPKPTKPKPKPPKPEPPKPEPPKPGFKCKPDGHKFCKSWKASGYCKVSSPHAAYMARTCSTTCKCCEDQDSRCGGWADYCSTNQYAKDNCRKKCGTCGQLAKRTRSFSPNIEQ